MQSGDGFLVRGKIIPGEGERWTRTHFHAIYHQVQSCGVRASWEGRYTPHISTLLLQYEMGTEAESQLKADFAGRKAHSEAEKLPFQRPTFL